jgi:heme-degrading monooxygenase HmoA
MIARVWHGWTPPENADLYEDLLRTRVLPHIGELEGSRGATLLRREAGREVEFVTITYFTSMDAVRAFAGDDYESAVVPPEAQALLSRFDQRSVHYEALLMPETAGAGG